LPTTKLEILPAFTEYFFYMKYSVNQRRISSFVVGRPRPEYGLPMAVIKK